MIKTFTQNDIIRFMYNEMPDEEKSEIKQVMLCNPTIQEIYKEFMTIKSQLPDYGNHSLDNVANRILNYSKSLNLHANK